jgi:ureidoglycolate dehydrogenase (NAD+)
VPRIALADLHVFITFAFQAAGMGAADSAIGAEVLVRTEARGFITHGVRHVPRYARAMRSGGIDPTARFEIIRQAPTTASIEGNAGMGHVVATKAVRLAIEKARGNGIAAVLVRNSTHLGALGHYALLAAEAGMIAMVYSTTPRVMKAPGSRSAVLGGSPLAYAVPSDPAPFVFDAAMSVVAGNRVAMAKERHERVPDGWIVDRQGRPSNDPADYRAGGALTPIAGHKGFGLALFGELIAGALTDLDWDSPEQMKTHQPGSVYFAELGPSDQWNSGHAFIVIDVAAFMDPPRLRGRAGRLTSLIRESPPEPGSGGVRIPGDRAHADEARAREHGVVIDDEHWAALAELAGELAIDPPRMI